MQGRSPKFGNEKMLNSPKSPTLREQIADSFKLPAGKYSVPSTVIDLGQQSFRDGPSTKNHYIYSRV
mgnify:CR=1 FL=1